MNPWRSFYFLDHVQNSGDFWPIMNLNFSKALADNRVLADIIVVQPRVTCLLTFPSAVQMMGGPLRHRPGISSLSLGGLSSNSFQDHVTLHISGIREDPCRGIFDFSF